MSVDTLRRLLEDRTWQLCAELADNLLKHEQLPSEGKAFVCYARCRSLSNLERYNEALEPGQIAAYLATELGDYDLLGRSLMEVAYIQCRIPGHDLDSIETHKRYLQHRSRYSPDVLKSLPLMLYNLAVMERSSHDHHAALEHFRLARDEARKAKLPPAQVEEFSRSYCWQALQVGDLTLAQRLIQEGEDYLRKFPQDNLARVHLLNDKAWYAFVTGNAGEAIALVMEAIPVADALNEAGLLAQCLITWSTVCRQLGDLDSAMSLGLWAHQEAQRSQRPELVEDVQRLLRTIRMQDRETVDRVMATMLRPA